MPYSGYPNFSRKISMRKTVSKNNISTNTQVSHPEVDRVTVQNVCLDSVSPMTEYYNYLLIWQLLLTKYNCIELILEKRI